MPASRRSTKRAIKTIIEAVGPDVRVQLGGGIRDLDTIERYLDDGISWVIIGTAAVKNPGFLHDACNAFPGQVIVGLDAREGKVATDGWSKMTKHDVIDIAKKFESYGVEAVVFTDIGRDGMMTGVNIEATVNLARALTIPVIASGGIHNIDDIKALKAVEGEGIIGAIAGRSLYEGTLDFSRRRLAACEVAAAASRAAGRPPPACRACGIIRDSIPQSPTTVTSATWPSPNASFPVLGHRRRPRRPGD